MALLKSGYLPVVRRGAFSHRYGGLSPLDVPTCANCSKPFINFCVLDTADPRVPFDLGVGELPLIYCVRCAACWYPFSYCIAAGQISVIELSRGPTDWWEEWYREFQDVLPVVKFDLIDVPPKLARLIETLHSGSDLASEDEDLWNDILGHRKGQAIDAINQFGGTPFSIQGVAPPACRVCKLEMSFLASLYNDPAIGLKFMPAEWAAQIMFFICIKCGVITVIHST